jgi:hypothetical protein
MLQTWALRLFVQFVHPHFVCMVRVRLRPQRLETVWIRSGVVAFPQRPVRVALRLLLFLVARRLLDTCPLPNCKCCKHQLFAELELVKDETPSFTSSSERLLHFFLARLAALV